MADFIFEKLRSVLSKFTTIPANFSEQARLRDDLGIDSLLTMDLLLELESTFAVMFPDEFLTAQRFETVGSLYGSLCELMP